MDLYTYAALITAFNDTRQVPVIESTLTVVYAPDPENARTQAILEAIDSTLPLKDGWTNHQATVHAIQGLLALGKTDCYIHLYAIRIYQKTPDGVKNLKVSLYYEIDRLPDSDITAKLRGQLATLYSPLDWEIVIDHMQKRVMFSDVGPASPN